MNQSNYTYTVRMVDFLRKKKLINNKTENRKANNKSPIFIETDTY